MRAHFILAIQSPTARARSFRRLHGHREGTLLRLTRCLKRREPMPDISTEEQEGVSAFGYLSLAWLIVLVGLGGVLLLTASL